MSFVSGNFPHEWSLNTVIPPQIYEPPARRPFSILAPFMSYVLDWLLVQLGELLEVIVHSLLNNIDGIEVNMIKSFEAISQADMIFSNWSIFTWLCIIWVNQTLNWRIHRRLFFLQIFMFAFCVIFGGCYQVVSWKPYRSCNFSNRIQFIYWTEYWKALS